MSRNANHLPPAPTPTLRRSTLVDVVDEAAANAPELLVHLDRPLDAFPDDGTTLTYAQLAERGRRLAAGLHAAGVRRGSRVAIVKRNHLDIYLLTYAAMRLGAVPALISPELSPEIAGQLLGLLDLDVVVSDRVVCEEKALRGLPLTDLAPTVLSVGEAVHGALPLQLDAPEAPAEVVRELDARVLITHTSGTTDVPKLAVQSNRTLAANWAAIPVWARVLGLRERVGIHLAFPHIRVVTGFTSLMAMRWSLVVITDPAPSNVDAVFCEYRPGVVETFPNTFMLWESLLASPSRPLGGARLFCNTFDAMHPRTMRALLDGSSRRNALYIQLYGQTETGPITTRFYTRGLARRADGRCVGHAVPGLSRFRIVPTAHGRARRTGAGEIQVRSKSLVLDYVGRSALHAANFRDGWWRMTDIGWRSRYGCLHLHDREIDETDSTESLLALEDVLLARMHDVLEGVLVPLGDGTITPIVCTHEDAPLNLSSWSSATADFPALNPPHHCRWGDIPRTATWKVRRGEARRMLERGSVSVAA
jgi:acyl-coenzyme A synthetase/AMP-(fatty) acid ligase